MTTASSLFSRDSGSAVCYYCGGPCSGSIGVDEYVKPTFTNRDVVVRPDSDSVCRGCADSLGQGDDEMMMIDGTVKRRSSPRGMQPRMYSWLLTRDGRVAGTKAHIKRWREVILDPPIPPFAIVLADSAQKQLIFRAPVAFSREVFPVMLEEEVIETRPQELARRIDIATWVCAAIGKPALLDCESVGRWITMESYHGPDLGRFEEWLAVVHEPMSRLAAWLSPGREEAQSVYPRAERGDVQAETRRTGRRGGGTAGRRQGIDQGGGSQNLLDFREPVQ